MKQPNPHPLLLLKWKDHKSSHGWEGVDDFHGPAAIYSVGWLYKEDDEGITIASAWSDDTHPETSELQYILKAAIVQRVIILKPQK